MAKILAMLCMIGWGTAACAAEPAIYVFDLMARQPYRANLNKLLAKQPVPDWVKDFLVAGAGGALPARTVQIGGTPFRLDHVCKVHDCAGHVLAVLWAPAGRRVWAAVVDKPDAPPVLFGDPSPEQARILADAAKS